MFYQINATSSWMRSGLCGTFPLLAESPRPVRSRYDRTEKSNLNTDCISSDSENYFNSILLKMQSCRANDNRYKDLECQLAIIQMRDTLMQHSAIPADSGVPKPYYTIARYFQQPYGWHTLTDGEREATSSFMEALYAEELAAKSPTPGFARQGTTKLMLDHIKDLPLLARLVAAQLSLGVGRTPIFHLDNF